jgi:hypothetical protein
VIPQARAWRSVRRSFPSRSVSSTLP